jgi:hypothetical protein
VSVGISGNSSSSSSSSSSSLNSLSLSSSFFSQLTSAWSCNCCFGCRVGMVAVVVVGRRRRPPPRRLFLGIGNSSPSFIHVKSIRQGALRCRITVTLVLSSLLSSFVVVKVVVVVGVLVLGVVVLLLVVKGGLKNKDASSKLISSSSISCSSHCCGSRILLLSLQTRTTCDDGSNDINSFSSFFAEAFSFSSSSSSSLEDTTLRAIAEAVGVAAEGGRSFSR